MRAYSSTPLIQSPTDDQLLDFLDMVIEESAGSDAPKPATEAGSGDAGPARPNMKFRYHDELLSAEFQPPAKRMRMTEGTKTIAPPTNWPPLRITMPQLVVRYELAEHIQAKMALQHAQSSAGNIPQLMSNSGPVPTEIGEEITLATVVDMPPPVAEPAVLSPVTRHASAANSTPVRELESTPASNSKVLPSLMRYHTQLGASGTFDLRELTDWLAPGKRFNFGQEERIRFAKDLMNLLARMSLVQGTPQARFDPQAHALLGKVALQWLSNTAFIVSQTEPGIPAVIRLPAPHCEVLLAENVINCHLLRLMRDHAKFRSTVLDLSDTLDRTEKKSFRWSIKFSVMREWGAGLIVLSPAELEALCTLRLENCKNSLRLLVALKTYVSNINKLAAPEALDAFAEQGLPGGPSQ